MFAGKSSLRAKEVVPVKVDPAMQSYLQRYESSGSGAPGAGSDVAKKKRKKKKGVASALAGVRIVDESVSGFLSGPAAADDEPEEDEDDEGYGVPVVANAEEAERAARQVEAAKRGFFGRREDGSGWQAAPEPADGPRPGQLASGSARQRHDSDSDAEPVRRTQRHDSDSDAAPPRRQQRHDSDSDAAPPRRKQRHDSDSDAAPPRRQQRHDSDSDSDAEPVRRRARHDSDDEDASPPRRGRQDSDADMSPPRRRVPDADDLSPPRKRAAPSEGASIAASAAEPGSKKPRMTDGTATGIITAGALKSEMERKRELERQRFAQLGAAATGRGAETVFRNKEGKMVSKAELDAARKAEAAAKEAERETPEWAAGLKQQREAAERRAATAAEASKPFARSKDDKDLDAMYRNQSRFGDPMAAYVKKRQSDEPPPIALPGGKRKKSGFVVPQGVPPHSWLKRNLGQPINRYHIRPGRHWDGVNRSTGFEEKYFRTLNERKFSEQQAKAWGQEDM